MEKKREKNPLCRNIFFFSTRLDYWGPPWGYGEQVIYTYFIKDGRNPENPGKNHLTIRKQNFAFPHVTQASLESQRWET